MPRPTTSEKPQASAWAVALLLVSSLFAVGALALLGVG